MSVAISIWMALDRLIKPVYRVFHYVMMRSTRIKSVNTHQVVVIKLFGLGSIVRLIEMCEDRGVDFSKIVIITSDSHREFCELCSLKAIYINTSSTWTLARGCLKAVLAVARIQPQIIVDFERCSNLVGILRTFMAWRSGCQALSFEQRTFSSSKAVIHPVDRLSQQQIFHEGLQHFPIDRKHRRFSTIPIDTGKVIVNINASDLLASRRYGLPLFASAIRLIHRDHPSLRFYLSGIKSERNYVQRLTEELKGLPVENVAGEWSLGKLMKELADCELLITVDSAPLHLGKYLNVTTLSLWGPTQPAHFGYSASARFKILSLELTCSPCFLHPLSKPAIACNGAVTCMKELSPEAVASAAIEILSESQTIREVSTPVNLRVESAPSVNAVG
jgi:hypothetical protein